MYDGGGPPIGLDHQSNSGLQVTPGRAVRAHGTNRRNATGASDADQKPARMDHLGERVVSGGRRLSDRGAESRSRSGYRNIARFGAQMNALQTAIVWLLLITVANFSFGIVVKFFP